MTNKTIALSHKACTNCGVSGSYHPDVKHCAHCAKAFAALADPVPPAGGETEEWCDKLHLLKVIQDVVSTNRMQVERPTDAEAAYAIYRAISEHLPIYEDVYDQVSELIEPLVARPHRPDGALPASVVGAVGVLLKDRTRLQAEVEQEKKRHRVHAAQLITQRGNLRERLDALQAELTKARELFAGLLPLHGYSMGLIVEVNEWMQANQSMPADKGQREPVADYPSAEIAEEAALGIYDIDFPSPEDEPAEQPAPVAVVMPDLDDHDRSGQNYWADQAAQGRPYEQQLREACERNGIDPGLDDE
jgi:hypothetical protein